MNNRISFITFIGLIFFILVIIIIFFKYFNIQKQKSIVENVPVFLKDRPQNLLEFQFFLESAFKYLEKSGGKEVVCKMKYNKNNVYNSYCFGLDLEQFSNESLSAGDYIAITININDKIPQELINKEIGLCDEISSVDFYFSEPFLRVYEKEIRGIYQTGYYYPSREEDVLISCNIFNYDFKKSPTLFYIGNIPKKEDISIKAYLVDPKEVQKFNDYKIEDIKNILINNSLLIYEKAFAIKNQ